MNSHSKKTAFEPGELATLQDIFDEITSQHWFPNFPEVREGFARYLFDTFPNGSFNPERHRSVVETSARMFYAIDETT